MALEELGDILTGTLVAVPSNLLPPVPRRTINLQLHPGDSLMSLLQQYMQKCPHAVP